MRSWGVPVVPRSAAGRVSMDRQAWRNPESGDAWPESGVRRCRAAARREFHHDYSVKLMFKDQESPCLCASPASNEKCTM